MFTSSISSISSQPLKYLLQGVLVAYMPCTKLPPCICVALEHKGVNLPLIVQWAKNNASRVSDLETQGLFLVALGVYMRTENERY